MYVDSWIVLRKGMLMGNFIILLRKIKYKYEFRNKLSTIIFNFLHFPAFRIESCFLTVNF